VPFHRAQELGGDTANFDSSLAGQTITLTRGEPAIARSLDIEAWACISG
jgi:hypothetical protein